MKSVLIVFLGVCLFSIVLSRPTGPGFSDLGVIGRLSIVESCNPSQDSSGAAGCWLTRKEAGSNIFCQIVHNLENPIFASLQSPSGYFFNFTQTDLQVYIEETFVLSSDGDDIEEADFLSGTWFIGIASTECPDTAIQATLNNDHNVFSYLLGSSSVGIAVSDYDPLSKSLETFISHSESQVDAYLVMQDNLGEAETIFEFSDNDSPIRQRINFISTREDELYHQKQFYLLQHSSALEGDLHVLDPTPEVNYPFEILPLDSSQFVNDSYVPSGAGLFSLYCQGIVEYLVVHNLGNIVTAELRLGTSDDAHVILHLETTRAPILGTGLVSYDNMQRMIQGGVYVVLKDDQDRTLVGKVSPAADYFAYLSPSQEVPRLSGLDRGIALAKLDGDVFASEIHFTVSDANGLALQRGGFAEETGDIFFGWELSEGSPAFVQKDLDSAEESAVKNGNAYFNVVTESVPSGVIRGQVLKRAELQCISYDGLNPYSSWIDESPFTDEFVFHDDGDTGVSPVIGVNWQLCFSLIVLSFLLWC